MCKDNGIKTRASEDLESASPKCFMCWEEMQYLLADFQKEVARGIYD